MMRSATIDDAPAIARVHVASWRSAYRGLIPAAYLDVLAPHEREPLWREVLAAADSDVLVAEDDGLCAFLHWGPARDDDAPKRTAEIRALYILETHWQRGIGRALPQRALDSARTRGFRAATLWVFQENDRARRFYARLGFRPDGATQATPHRSGALLQEVRYRRELRALPEPATTRQQGSI